MFSNLGEVVLRDHGDGRPKIYHRCNTREEAEELTTQLNIMTPEELDAFYEGDVDTTPLYKNPIKEYQMTMTEEPTTMTNTAGAPPEPVTQVQLGGRRVILTFNRSKEQTGGGWAKVEAAMEVDLPVGISIDEVPDLLARETSVLKSHVLTELDLPFSYEEDTQRVMEVFPQSTVVASAPQTPPQGQLQAPPPIPQAPAQGQQGGFGPSWDDIATRLQNGTLEQAYYDNRFSKKSPNSPDFNYKTPGPDGKRRGFWIDSQYPNQACPEHLRPIVTGQQ